MLNVKLRINYDNGTATLLDWNDLGSDPAITVDTVNSKVFVTPFYDWRDKTCKALISFKLVFDADGKEYTNWFGVTADPTGSRIFPPIDLFSRYSSLSATITKVPCELEEIPEFPTIALPIIAVLGLAFFFQRRRD